MVHRCQSPRVITYASPQIPRKLHRQLFLNFRIRISRRNLLPFTKKRSEKQQYKSLNKKERKVQSRSDTDKERECSKTVDPRKESSARISENRFLRWTRTDSRTWNVFAWSRFRSICPVGVNSRILDTGPMRSFPGFRDATGSFCVGGSVISTRGREIRPMTLISGTVVPSGVSRVWRV